MIEFPDSSFDRTQQHFASRILNWIIDWKMRRAVNLQKWLREQVENPGEELINYADLIATGKNHDETVRNVLLQVLKDLKYVTDDVAWKIPEYWQTAQETLEKRTGDCEDGSIFIYVICRLKGVPANRFLIFAGDVKGGGHCWLGYKPSFAPWLFTFMDWSYWPSKLSVVERDKFFVMEEGSDNVVFPKGTNYYMAWFGFNENVAFNRFKLKF